MMPRFYNHPNEDVLPAARMRMIVVACILACAACDRRGFAQLAGSAGPTPMPAAPVAQFNGNKIQLPAKRPTSRRSGLTLTVDPRWTNNYGYRPVEITIASPMPTTADHSIRIRLHAGWYRNVSVEQDFDLPLGSTSVTTTVSLPTYQTSMNYYWWDLWVDGVKDKDLSVDRVASLAFMGGATASSNASVTFLVAGPQKNHRSLVATNAMELEALSLNLSAFPTRWIDYTAFDVVAISLDEARQLAKNQPAAFEAICRWARAGGQLWISDVGKELEHLPEVSQLLHVPETMITEIAESTAGESATPPKDNGEKAEDTTGDEANTHLAQEGWRSLRFRRFRSDGQVNTYLDTRTGARRTVRDPEMIARLEGDPNVVTTEQRFDPDAANTERRSPTDSSPWYVEQSLGLGKVRAFRGANEAAKFPQMPATANPNAVANSDAPDDLPRSLSYGLRRVQRWDSRHGLTPDSANAEFAKLLVPGVGLAPVTEFRVLITLFVLLIGPINYWLLKRAKRLHLMVLTVPAAALVTTLALFGYAILADGFDTRVRAQSFTTLDQRTGEAACWARLSYYSGLAPGNGLIMPTDVAVYPILPTWAGDSNMMEQRDVVWGDSQSQLKQGWLNSRTPTQYLTIRARKSPHQIEVLDSGDKMRVKNRLDANILSLVVMNDAGKMYWGDDIAEEASAMLKPVGRDHAIRRINKLIVDNTPQEPTALAGGESDLATLRSRSRYPTYGRNGLQFSTGKLSANLAGEALTNLAGFGGQPALDLPPRSYVAITERGPEVEVGVSYAKEEASFHVVVGKW